MDDATAMARAVALGKLGRRTAAPNPWVGCVLVRGGAVVGEGYHRVAGEPHAEARAVATALATDGTTACVTLASADALDGVLEALAAGGAIVRGLATGPPTLEDAYFAIAGGAPTAGRHRRTDGPRRPRRAGPGKRSAPRRRSRRLRGHRRSVSRGRTGVSCRMVPQPQRRWWQRQRHRDSPLKRGVRWG